MYQNDFALNFSKSRMSNKGKECTMVQDKLKPLYHPKNICYKPLEYEWEVKQLAILFKQWFPIEYPQEFYDSLLDGKSYFTILCVYEDSDPIILGCIMYEVKPLDYTLATLPLAYISKENRSVHIMALGVAQEARNQGIATVLLQKVLDVVRKDSNFKCTYLNVIVHNKAAINCYEKNGFMQVTTTKGYYEISKEKIYESFVYCLYTHGGQKPRNMSGFTKENLPYGYLNPFYAFLTTMQTNNQL